MGSSHPHQPSAHSRRQQSYKVKPKHTQHPGLLLNPLIPKLTHKVTEVTYSCPQCFKSQEDSAQLGCLNMCCGLHTGGLYLLPCCSASAVSEVLWLHICLKVEALQGGSITQFHSRNILISCHNPKQSCQQII